MLVARTLLALAHFQDLDFCHPPDRPTRGGAGVGVQRAVTIVTQNIKKTTLSNHVLDVYYNVKVTYKDLPHWQIPGAVVGLCFMVFHCLVIGMRMHGKLLHMES